MILHAGFGFKAVAVFNGFQDAFMFLDGLIQAAGLVIGEQAVPPQVVFEVGKDLLEPKIG